VNTSILAPLLISSLLAAVMHSSLLATAICNSLLAKVMHSPLLAAAINTSLLVLVANGLFLLVPVMNSEQVAKLRNVSGADDWSSKNALFA